MKIKSLVFLAVCFLSSFAVDSHAASAPVVSTQSAINIASTSAVLRGTVHSDGGAATTDYGFEYGPTQSYGTRASLGVTSAGTFFLPVSGLVASTTYNFRSYAVNSVGTSTGSNQVFFTDSLRISGLATSTTSTSTSISFSTNNVASSTLFFGTTTSYGVTRSLSATTTHTYTISNLVPNTSHHFSIIVSDEAGNSATTSTDYLVVTPADVTPPVLSGAAIGVTSSYVSVSWLTNEPSDARIIVGTTTAYGMASSTSVLETGHQLYLQGLLPSTVYYLRYISTDAYGNVATSSEQTFTTTAPNITAQSVAVTVAISSSIITWQTGENALSQVAYGVTASYATTTPLMNGPFGRSLHTVSLTNFVACTTYHYAIVTVAGVSTATSSDATFTTLGCVAPPSSGRSGSRSSASISNAKNKSTVVSVAAPAATSPQTVPVGVTLPTPIRVGDAPTTTSFTRNLMFGMSGADVRTLQLTLIKKATGPAAKSLEVIGVSNYFGQYTRNALIEYQKAQNIFPTLGYFGPLTRARIVSL